MLRLIYALGIALILSACGGGAKSGSTPVTPPVIIIPPPVATSASVYGKIIDFSSRLPIAGATVQVGGKTIKSGVDGGFFAENIPFGRVIIAVTSARHAANFVPMAINAAQALQSIDIELQPVSAEITFDPAAGQILKDPASAASVMLAASSLVGPANAAPVGTVTAKITPLIPKLMPGDFTTATAEQIQSFGAMSVEFSDANGTKLNLASGQIATIRIPATPVAGVALPLTTPLYYFNETTGYWVKEGTAQLIQGSGENYYEGTVTHFSVWNSDDVINTVFIKGRVVDADGIALAGVTIKCTGISYIATMGEAKNEYLSNSTGAFSLPMKSNATAECYASLNGIVSNKIKVTSLGTTITLTDNFVLPISKVSSISLADTFTRVDTYPYPFGGSVIEIQVPFQTVGITLDWPAITAGLTHWEITPIFTNSDGLSSIGLYKDGNGTYIQAYRFDDAKTPNTGVMSFKGTFRISEGDNRNNQLSLSFLVRLVGYQQNVKLGGTVKISSEFRKITIPLKREPAVFAGFTLLPMFDDHVDVAGAAAYCASKGYRLPTKEEAIAVFPNGPYGNSSGSGIGDIWSSTRGADYKKTLLPDNVTWIYGTTHIIVSRFGTTREEISEATQPLTLCIK